MNNNITNTKKQAEKSSELILAQMLGEPSPSIEQQEARGQQEALQSDTIPTNYICCTRENLLQLGFQFPDEPTGDPLFQFAILPTGWKREGSDHDMWHYILDIKGRKRCAVFYKAAFYDRKAHIKILPFWKLDYVSDDQWTICNADGFRGPTFGFNAAEKYLKKTYPDYQNVLAYWTD